MDVRDPIASSFRDPSGFVYRQDGILFRQINRRYEQEWRRLRESGLLEELTSDRLLVPAEEEAGSGEAFARLRPAEIPFISYPYEWCFGQLKDAALLTLEIARRSLNKGMVLKDASAYNVQFFEGQPIFIDSLSFESYREGDPWIAYGQFCRHFLAPLALMALVDVRLSSLLRTYLDGIPLDLAAKLLPSLTKLKPGLLAHIHVHASAQNRIATDTKANTRLSKVGHMALIDSLKGTVQSLQWQPRGTEWGDYYRSTNYSDTAMASKQGLVREFLGIAQPGTCWDLGANTGEFSRIAAESGVFTIAWDIDPAAVEKAYRQRYPSLLPLLQDLTNPSPGVGWSLEERSSLLQRGPVDLVMALALIHHLAIGNNVPLERIASFLANLGKWLVLEFVPKSDSQVARMLANRRDIFDHYHLDGLVEAFASRFDIVRQEKVEGSERTLLLMRRCG